MNTIPARPGDTDDPGFLKRARIDVPSNHPPHEVVGSWALRPVGRRAGLLDYLRQLGQRRHFIWADARSRAHSKNHGMLLGNLWLVLLPILDGIVYYVIFGLILEVSRGMDNFIGFLLIGIFMFQYTARSLTSGATAVTGARNMVRAFTFPRASLPISVVLREAISMAPVVATLIPMLLLIPPRTDVTSHWTLFPAIFALHGIFNLGIAFFAARATSQVPDIRHIIGIFARVWRYGSAVIFPIDRRFIDSPQVLAIIELNPLFIIIDMYRQILLDAELPSAHQWVLLSCWALGTAILGFLYFWRGEERYGNE